MGCDNVFYGRRRVTLACALVLFSAALAIDLPHKSKMSTRKSSAIEEGAALYKRNCAVCHGNDAKGGSPPKSRLFTQPAPDLTTLAKRHDGKFPKDYVATVLRSGVKVPDHGPAEMPVWGTIFKASASGNEAQGNQRIAALTAYLKSLQVK
jgi:mono/diheme cytochrome c family protein